MRIRDQLKSMRDMNFSQVRYGKGQQQNRKLLFF